MNANHPLVRWLVRTPGGRTKLAREAGIRWQTVDDIIKGKHVPRASTAIALSRATGGEVSAAAILGLDEHPVTDAAAAAARKTAQASSGQAVSDEDAA